MLENLSPIGVSIDGDVLLRREDYHWLIEQAEKTEIYKEALENIEALSFFSDGFSDKEKFVAALYHAKKALEGNE